MLNIVKLEQKVKTIWRFESFLPGREEFHAAHIINLKLFQLSATVVVGMENVPVPASAPVNLDGLDRNVKCVSKTLVNFYWSDHLIGRSLEKLKGKLCS